MSGLHRPTPDAQVIELTKRLAEDYPSIPLPEVSRVVKDAVATVIGDTGWAGTPAGIPAIVDVIELLAREDLDAVSRASGLTGASAGRARRATAQRGRRRAAE